MRMLKVAGLLVVAGTVALGANARAVESPVEPGVYAAADTTGKRIFETKGNCGVCHGMNAKGTALAPDLTDAAWLHADGTVETIAKVVKEGVATPKEHPAPMPPMGGAQLTDEEIQAVSRYVASLSAGAGG